MVFETYNHKHPLQLDSNLQRTLQEQTVSVAEEEKDNQSLDKTKISQAVMGD